MSYLYGFDGFSLASAIVLDDEREMILDLREFFFVYTVYEKLRGRKRVIEVIVYKTKRLSVGMSL